MMMWTRGVTRGDLPLRFTVRRRGGESVSVARVDVVNSFIHAFVLCISSKQSQTSNEIV